MTEALATATELLSAGWTFISGNAVLFGCVAVGLLGTAVMRVKSFF